MGNFITNLVEKAKSAFSDPRMNELEPICRDLRRRTQGVMLWEKDDRFRAVLSPFDLHNERMMREILNKHFPLHYTMANVASAPERVGYIFRELGSLVDGHELYVRNPEKEIILYAAWWPWEDGQTVTLRIGFVAPDMLPSQENKLFRKVRQWFGLIVID